MKSILLGAIFGLAGVVLVGCSSAGTTDEGTSADEALSAPSTASGHTIMKVNPDLPDLTARRPTASSGAVGECPYGERVCQFANDKGICVDRCVPDGVLCAKPDCVVCDPDGPQPHAGCTWNSEECQWDCPVCDPPPPPKSGCTWDAKACVWLCL